MGGMMPGQPSYFQTIMQAYLQGLEMRRQREAQDQQNEERKLQLERLKFEQNRIKLEDKIRAQQMNREGALGNLKMMEGMLPPMEQQDPGFMGPPQQLGPTSMQIPGISAPEAGIDIAGLQAPIRYATDMQSILAEQAERAAALEAQKVAMAEQARLGAQRAPRTDVPGYEGQPVAGDLADNVLSLLGQERTQRGSQEFQRSQSAESRQHDLRMEGVRSGNARTLEQERRAAARAEEANKPLSGEASKVLAIANTIQPEIEQLKDAFQNDYARSVRGIVSGTDRRLTKLVDQVADKVGRLRSGGAINKDEEARFKRQIASLPDLAFGDSASAIEALDGIIAEAQQVAGTIRPRSVSVQAGQPAPRLSSRPRAVGPNGQIIEFNGTAWVPVQ